MLDNLKLIGAVVFVILAIGYSYVMEKKKYDNYENTKAVLEELKKQKQESYICIEK